MSDQAPSFKGRKASSPRASRAAAGASRKSGTRCETKLSSLLWRAGARYRRNVDDLPGKPDIVFPGARLVIFCDGDFWHGKDWQARRKRLAVGSNPGYWIAKIERNMARDREHTTHLEAQGWKVLRYWESEIHRNADTLVQEVLRELRALDKRSLEGVRKA
jgi:DNA mismatch endonuclease (patch repair protein)